jgi:hypothetical protein
MAHDEGAPCRHLGAPPEHLIVQVADLIQKQLSADDKYLASLGLTASEYRSALPAAIERVRGSWAASNENSRDFVEVLLSELVSQNIISDYEKPRYGSDTIYKVALRSGQKIAVIQKGCPDGSHSSTQWSRPSWAHETYLWWLCSSQRYHPGEHIWKGVGRLRQKVSEGSDQLDGIIFYNELCGTGSRPCPKIDQAVEIEGKRYPPPRARY